MNRIVMHYQRFVGLVWRFNLSLLALSMLGGTAAADVEFDLPAIENARPRNVIFILVDDMRHDVMSFAGHAFVKTPHIDRLASEGVHFRNAFVKIGRASC